LNEKCTELERLRIGHEDTEATAALINEKWQDVRGQFQHFQKGSKEKTVPDSKMVCRAQPCKMHRSIRSFFLFLIISGCRF
jgi:hypothetical protein